MAHRRVRRERPQSRAAALDRRGPEMIDLGMSVRREARQAAVVNAWNRFWFEPGSATTLGVCRLLFFGGLAMWLMSHDFAAWGSYSSVFWMPIWLFDTLGLPQLSAPTIAAIQAVWKTALVLSAVGLFTRSAMLVVFVFGI